MGRKERSYDRRGMSPLFAVPTRRIITPSIFRSMYPLCHSLGLRPVSVRGNDYEGLDIDEVEKKLGAQRFASLQVGLREVFCCAHRTWPADHPDLNRRGCEVHCVYARDLEEFLQKQPTGTGRNQDGSL